MPNKSTSTFECINSINNSAVEKGEKVQKSQNNSAVKFGASSLIVNEAELQKAGIGSYRVRVRCTENGTWRVLYDRESVISSDKSPSTLKRKMEFSVKK